MDNVPVSNLHPVYVSPTFLFQPDAFTTITMPKIKIASLWYSELGYFVPKNYFS